MKKAFLIARSNFRKSKGQVISIAALMLIVGMMLNLWLILQMDYKKNFERHHDRLNAEHVAMCVNIGSMNESEKLSEKLTDVIENDSRTDEYSIDDALLMPGSFQYNGGDLNTTCVFLDKETAVSRSVGKIEIVEDSDEISGIYVPMIYKSEEIAIGKQMKITSGTYEFNYTICGFTNSVMGAPTTAPFVKLFSRRINIRRRRKYCRRKTPFLPMALCFAPYGLRMWRNVRAIMQCSRMQFRSIRIQSAIIIQWCISQDIYHR